MSTPEQQLQIRVTALEALVEKLTAHATTQLNALTAGLQEAAHRLDALEQTASHHNAAMQGLHADVQALSSRQAALADEHRSHQQVLRELRSEETL